MAAPKASGSKYLLEIGDLVETEDGVIVQVQQVNDWGIRGTLLDWMMGSFTGYDVLLPWVKIEGRWVATKDHDKAHFIREVAHRSEVRKRRQNQVSP